jgi:hypothetical protein
VSFMHPQHPCKYSRNINKALGPSPRGWGELAAELKEATAARTIPTRVGTQPHEGVGRNDDSGQLDAIRPW